MAKSIQNTMLLQYPLLTWRPLFLLNGEALYSFVLVLSCMNSTSRTWSRETCTIKPGEKSADGPDLCFFGGEHTHGKGCCLESSSLPFHLSPSSWDHSALPDVGYKLVVVPNSTKEYSEIKELFEKSMEGFVIRRLLRNQNPSLWQVFQWQKEQMRKRNGGKAVDERLLFHGTSASHLHDICGQNLDWRICGTHGTLYGKGSYFAKDASYSHQYCQPDSSFKTMFVARVLVGDYVQGNVAYLRPPPRPDQRNGFYDSCVDSLRDPSIFVIFEKHQIYPEYVIEYKQVSQCTVM